MKKLLVALFLSALAFNCAPPTDPVQPKAATPTFSLPAGTYNGTQSVALSTTTVGASIYFTVDGSVPSASNGTLYAGPVPVNSVLTLSAIAVKGGFQNSAVAQALYSVTPDSNQVEPVVISLASGTYTGTQTVNLTCATAGATIRYTLDGTTPSALNGNDYTAAIDITGSSELRAFASKATMTNSVVSTAFYIIKAAASQVAQPVPSKPAGTYDVSVAFTLSCSTPGSTIYYTWDGSTPDSATSTECTGTLLLFETTTVKAIAVKAGMADSPVMTVKYTIPSEHLVITGNWFDGTNWYNGYWQDETFVEIPRPNLTLSTYTNSQGNTVSNNHICSMYASALVDGKLQFFGWDEPSLFLYRDGVTTLNPFHSPDYTVNLNSVGFGAIDKPGSDDVYFTGSHSNNSGLNEPGYYKNGTWTALPLPVSSDRLSQGASQIRIFGTDVYIMGSSFHGVDWNEVRHHGFYWKNGSLIELPLQSGYDENSINDILVDGATTYLLLNDSHYTSGASHTYLSANGVVQEMSVITAGQAPNPIQLGKTTLGHVYAAGTSWDPTIPASYPSIWKDGSGTLLPLDTGAYGAQFSSMFVNGNTVYVLGQQKYGTDENDPNAYFHAGYWKSIDGIDAWTWYSLAVPTTMKIGWASQMIKATF